MKDGPKVDEKYSIRGYVLDDADWRQEEGDGDDDVKRRTKRFRVSTPDKDRHRTRISPEGIDTSNYEKNPIFLWAHDGYGGWETPNIFHVLGRVVDFTKTRRAFDVDAEFLSGEVNGLAEIALGMVNAKALNAVSIGFIPKEIVFEKDSDGSDRDVPHITKCELLEVSLVPIPSNPNALELARSMVSADLRNLGTKPQWVCAGGRCAHPHETLEAAEACSKTASGRSFSMGEFEVRVAPNDDVELVVPLGRTVEEDDDLIRDEVRGVIAEKLSRIAAIDRTGSELPFADRDHPWDARGAVRRLRESFTFAVGDGFRWNEYGRGFFWHDADDSGDFSGYRLPFADVVDGRLVAVPEGVAAAASRLESSDLPPEEKEEVRSRIDACYARMRAEFDDDGLAPPWERALCGAPKADGEACRQPAGFGTEHAGCGSCKYHDQDGLLASFRNAVNQRVQTPPADNAADRGVNADTAGAAVARAVNEWTGAH